MYVRAVEARADVLAVAPAANEDGSSGRSRMSGLLDFFTAGPARVKGLLIAFLALVALGASLACWALLERASAIQARAERDRALDQVAVVSAAAKACSASVDQAREVGEAAIAATGELVAAAKRLAAPAVHTVERIEKGPRAPTPPGAGCDQAWDVIEQTCTKPGRRDDGEDPPPRWPRNRLRRPGRVLERRAGARAREVEVPVACVSAADVPPRPAAAHRGRPDGHGPLPPHARGVERPEEPGGLQREARGDRRGMQPHPGAPP
jgi:hypothetical protein